MVVNQGRGGVGRAGARPRPADEQELIPTESANPDPDTVTPEPSHGPVAEA
jgi:hypothetical protein